VTGGSCLSASGGVDLVAATPASPQPTLFALSSYATPQGIYRSLDGGVSWQLVLQVINAFHGGFWTSFAFDARAGQRLYAGNDFSQVLTSADRGASWTPVNLRWATCCVALAVDPSDPDHAFASSSQYGIASTSDAFASSTHEETGLYDYADFAVATYEAFPHADVWGETGELGAMHSFDGGGAWGVLGMPTATALILRVNQATHTPLYAGTYSGVERSTDGGATWSQTLSAPYIDALALDPSASGTVYAGSYDGGLFRSRDAGQTWTNLTASIGDASINALEVDAGSGTVYAATTSSGVWRSDDDGTTWRPTAFADGFANALAVDPTTNAVYAGLCFDATRTVLRSDDGGVHWTVAQGGLPTATCINDLRVPAAASGLVVAATSNKGVYASADRGASWTPLGADSYDGAAYQLAGDAHATELYTGSPYGVLDYTLLPDVALSSSVSAASVTTGSAVTFTVTARNAGPNPATGVHVVDTPPSGVSVISASASSGSCSIGAATLTCSLGALAPGSSATLALTLQPSAVGTFANAATVTIDQHQTDTSNDSTSATTAVIPAQPSFAPDTTPPADVRMHGAWLSRRFRTTRSFAIGWSASDSGTGVAAYDVRLRTASFGAPLGAPHAWQRATSHTTATYRAGAGNTACFEVRATDVAGNVSTWSADHCTTVVLGASRFAHSAGWHATAGSGDAGAGLTATHTGASIRTLRMSARRIALVADRCATCGRLRVTFAGRSLATLDLHSKRRARAAIIPLTAFASARRGNLTITSLDQRTVTIEAVAATTS
jgi:uncharacterized repeat protein (TIGR01451 family)